VRRDVEEVFLGCLRAMNCPIWLPITRTICRSDGSDCESRG